MGIFDKTAGVFTTYRVRLEFRDKLMAGIPGDPKLIAGWIRAKAGVSDEQEVRRMLLRTMVEIGADPKPDDTLEDLYRASEELASTRQACVFKRDEQGLYLESRCVKAMLKESTNIVFGDEGWLKRAYKTDASKTTSGKSPKSVVAERVFVNPDRLHLGVSEPTDVQLFVGHVPEKPGSPNKRSTLNHYEYVERPALEFDVLVAGDVLSMEQWGKLWVHAQENGLGSLRSQGFGRFDVTALEKVS